MSTAGPARSKCRRKGPPNPLNADNFVSFDIDGSDIVRIWYIGSETPLLLKPAVPAAALLELLHGRQWLL